MESSPAGWQLRCRAGLSTSRRSVSPNIPFSVRVKPSHSPSPQWVVWASPQPGRTAGFISLSGLFPGLPHTGMWCVDCQRPTSRHASPTSVRGYVFRCGLHLQEKAEAFPTMSPSLHYCCVVGHHVQVIQRLQGLVRDLGCAVEGSEDIF